jgi:hypothetical protein
VAGVFTLLFRPWEGHTANNKYSLLPARHIQHIISYPPQDILFLLRPATATIFNQVGTGDSILLFNPFSNKLYLELSSIEPYDSARFDRTSKARFIVLSRSSSYQNYVQRYDRRCRRRTNSCQQSDVHTATIRRISCKLHAKLTQTSRKLFFFCHVS